MKKNEITSIEPQQKQRGRFSVFIDGEFSFGIADIDLYNLKLAVGDIVDEKLSAKIEETIDVQKCRDYAVSLVSKKMYTKKELREKMQRKGYSETSILGTLDILEEYGYINDDLYAKMFCEYQCQKFGVKKIKYDLVQKGIEKDIIEKYISVIDNKDELSELMKRKIKFPFDKKEKDKIIRYFLSKGFEYDKVAECLNSLLKEEKEFYD